MLSLTPNVSGASDGPTLFFVQGWPDHSTLWDELVATLRDRYRCVRLELPNYAGAEYRRWGFRHEEVVAALARCIRAVSPDRPLTVVAHDWGAFWTYRLHCQHPELVNRIVALDIGPDFKPTPREVLLVVAYQWWLVAAFVVGGPLGDAMTRALAHRYRPQRAGEVVRATFNYPYFYTWKEIVTGQLPSLGRYEPEVPYLFVYGKRKPARFHTDRWLDFLRSRPRDQVVELAEATHWVTLDPRLSAIVKAFLDRTNG